MGLILCKKHGNQGIEFVCPHVAAAISAQASCKAQLRRYGLADDPELEDVEDACIYCSTCIEEHCLPPDQEKISESFWEGIASLHRPVCISCLEEWKSSNLKG